MSKRQAHEHECDPTHDTTGMGRALGHILTGIQFVVSRHLSFLATIVDDGRRFCMVSSAAILIRRMAGAAASSEGPIATILRKKLTQTFKPTHLSVVCESEFHNVPKGAEKHFLVQIVSELFEGKTVLQRHRLVNECLAAELRNEVHALRIDAVPPSKFDGSPAAEAPKCMGGAKR